MKRLLGPIAALSLLAVVAFLPAAVAGASDEVYTGTLSGSAEVPSVSTQGTGTVYVFINPAGTELKYAVSYTGLSGSLVAAHINGAAAGVSGPIMFTLAVGPSTMFGTLTQANFQSSAAVSSWTAALNMIRSGSAYLNLHTAAHPAGEVRAQLKSAAPAPTPTPTPTPQPTAAPTSPPTANPGGSTAATAAPHTATPKPKSLPPTAAETPTGRGTSSDFGSILAILGIGIVGGLIAVAKVRPQRPKPED
jgi:hypothetical protein